MKTNIEVFRNAIPLITDLRDESMRERHWKELRFEVKEDFDENAEDFTLEKILISLLIICLMFKFTPIFSLFEEI